MMKSIKKEVCKASKNDAKMEMNWKRHEKTAIPAPCSPLSFFFLRLEGVTHDNYLGLVWKIAVNPVKA